VPDIGGSLASYRRLGYLFNWGARDTLPPGAIFSISSRLGVAMGHVAASGRLDRSGTGCADGTERDASDDRGCNDEGWKKTGAGTIGCDDE
jgi:hypothetical protein